MEHSNIFNVVKHLGNDCYLVRNNNKKHNIINSDGVLLLNNWYYRYDGCYGPFCVFYQEEKYHIFDMRSRKETDLNHNIPIVIVEYLDNKDLIKFIDDKWNRNYFSKSANKFLFSEWIKEGYEIYKNYLLISKQFNDSLKYNIYNTKTNKVIFNEWFDKLGHELDSNGYFFGTIDDKSFLLTRNGGKYDIECANVISRTFNRDVNILYTSNGIRLYNSTTKTLSSILPFKDIKKWISNDLASVEVKDNSINIYDFRSNKLLLPYNVDRIDVTETDIILRHNKKQNIFNDELNKIVSNIWFDSIEQTAINYFNDYRFNLLKLYKKRQRIVHLNNKYNILNIDNGQLLLDSWVDSIISIENKYARVTIDGIIKKIAI